MNILTKDAQEKSFLPINTINTIAILALASVIIRPFLLEVPQPFPGFARAGEVWNNLALAYIGAWFFNALAIERPKRAASKSVMRAYKDELIEVSTKGTLLLRAVSEKKGQEAPLHPTGEQVANLCRTVSRGSRAPYYTFRGKLTSQSLDWIEYFELHLDSADKANSRLVPALPFLRPETISLLQTVRNSEFEQLIRKCSEFGLISDSLEPLAESLHRYAVDCQRLETHLGLAQLSTEVALDVQPLGASR